eukprot:6570149-Karenia_brevis.AAC.1
MGGLTVIGPSPLQQRRTCISGQTCKLDGILGQDLSSSDRYMVLDTCGQIGLVHRFAQVPVMMVMMTVMVMMMVMVM